MRLSVLCKTESLGALACSGGINPDGIEGFGHVEENCAGEPLFIEMPGYSSNEAGHLQRRAIPGSNPKLLVSHQFAFIYYM